MTSQISDFIVFDGLRRSLYSHPSPFPSGFNLPPRQFFSGEDHRNARGYCTTWEVKDGRLFVVAFGGTVETSLDVYREVGMQEIYGTEEPVWADWVSQTLIIPVGELIRDPEGFRPPTSTAYCDVLVAEGRIAGMSNRAGAGTRSSL